MQRRIFTCIFSVQDNLLVTKGTSELKGAVQGARGKPDMLEPVFVLQKFCAMLYLQTSYKYIIHQAHYFMCLLKLLKGYFS